MKLSNKEIDKLIKKEMREFKFTLIIYIGLIIGLVFIIDIIVGSL